MRRGFTLIETLVVISITLILSALTLAYNRSSEGQLILYKDHAIVVGLFNQARSFAAQKYQDPSIPGYLTCAFGLHFESGSNDFVFFQDLGEGGCLPAETNYRYDGGVSPSEAIETLSLDPRLEFEGIPEDGLDVFFVPPDINASSSTDLPVSVVIKTVDGKFRVTTTVASGGQIVTE